MTRTDSRRILGTAIVAFSLLAMGATPTFAQETPAAGATAGSSTAADTDGDGFDMGLLGLLGLAGLLGLRRPQATVTRVDRVDTTPSTRPRV